MVQTDQELLDEAKVRYLKAKQDVEDLRLRIAQAICPFALRDTVPVMRNGRQIEFLVEHISYAIEWSVNGELLGPVVGAATGWSVSGPKINKSDGKPGMQQAAINSLDFQLTNGVWLERRQTLTDFLGLA